MKSKEKTNLTFINQNSPWRLIVPAVGLVVFFTGVLVFEDTSFGKLLQPTGMLLTFLPYFIPFKFKNTVRYSKKGLHVKLNQGGTKVFRYSQIKYLEAFDKYLLVWKNKKKSVKLDVSAYSKEDVNRLIDLMQPATVPAAQKTY